MDRTMNPAGPLHCRGGYAGAGAAMSAKMAAHAHAKKAVQQRQRQAKKDASSGKAAGGGAAAARPKPRRPPSAYSLFFKQERKKLLGSGGGPGGARGAGGKPSDDSANGLLDRIIANGGGLAPSSSSSSCGNDVSSDDEGGNKRAPGADGGAAAEAASRARLMNEIAKTVSRRWKQLDESSRSVFEALALLERKKYERETEIWNRERKVEEERQAKKFKTKFLELPSSAAAGTAKRKRGGTAAAAGDEENGAAEKTKKKARQIVEQHAKTSAAAVASSYARAAVPSDPLRSKQVLPHMLGHGARRFGVPKHVMEKAFSKSRGQRRGGGRKSQPPKAEPVTSSQPNKAPEEKRQDLTADAKSLAKSIFSSAPYARFGVPPKVFGRMPQKAQTTEKKPKAPEMAAVSEVKKLSPLAVPRDVRQKEELRDTQEEALDVKSAVIAADKVASSPKQAEAPREEPSPQQKEQQLELLPSIAAALNIAGGSSAGIDSFRQAFGEAFDPAPPPPAAPFFSQPTVQPSTSPPPEAVASALELVRPLEGGALAASALHAQAALAHQAICLAEEPAPVSQGDGARAAASLDMMPPASDAFPCCDLLMLQRSLESRPTGLCPGKGGGSAAAAPSGTREKTPAAVFPGTHVLTPASTGNDCWWDDDAMVEPTPLPSGTKEAVPVIVPTVSSPSADGSEVDEADLNMSIADIFGVKDFATQPDNPQARVPSTGAAVHKKEPKVGIGLGIGLATSPSVGAAFQQPDDHQATVPSVGAAFPDAPKAVAAVHEEGPELSAVEPDCIAALQLRAQRALSSGNGILSRQNSAGPGGGGSDGGDDHLDRESINFLMTVFQ